MILILSTDGDISTNEVIESLIIQNTSFFRFNDNDIFNSDFNCFIENGEIKFTLTNHNKTIHSDEISIVWYRKFGFYNYRSEYISLKNSSYIELLKQFTNEYFTITQIIFAALKSKKWLFNKHQAITSKYLVLAEAKKVGLKIPESLIINSKGELKKFIDINKNVITKTIKEANFVRYEQNLLTMFTTEINPNELDEALPRNFMPSLVQSKIEKEFELRIFFIDNQFYPMAIFSQADKQTEVDFRNYNRQVPNRNVPYILPKELKKLLKLLMKNLGLNTGSIDMIYTKEKEYIFLEVNPSGQFGMTSKPCNYNIEEKIADYLKTNA
jgi:ATP-GRASP peptide maturase of grasp-with-spasm system